ncbi:hypothetical protein [Chitinophaga sp.]|uniref:hypothetical protein n=1 Tax=Chitinophaga sp. TaxID=1869181 RepID=UPI002BD5DC4D|nr:hypothetical protein [Chitinophaga sp.]HWV69515.1 hypothetical protein [Chitinophaga sp.]
MTALLFLKCIGCGLLGIAVHLFFEIRDIRKQSLAANKPTSRWGIIKTESDNIILSVLAVVVFTVGFDEIAKAKPVILEWVKWFFIFVGFAGSYILFALFSKAKKQILEVIDKKTNIADGVE